MPHPSQKRKVDGQARIASGAANAAFGVGKPIFRLAGLAWQPDLGVSKDRVDIKIRSQRSFCREHVRKRGAQLPARLAEVDRIDRTRTISAVRMKQQGDDLDAAFFRTSIVGMCSKPFECPFGPLQVVRVATAACEYPEEDAY